MSLGLPRLDVSAVIWRTFGDTAGVLNIHRIRETVMLAFWKNLLPSHSEATAPVPPVIKSGSFSPDAEDARKAFFEYKKQHPDEPKELTPLQQRMQSGGA